MKYKWKAGAMVKADANVAGAVCAELEAKGMLTAQSLVDVSRPEDAPLHNAFEWDDAVAAEEWRKHKARGIIATLVTVSETGEEVRSFFNIEVRKPEYESREAIFADVDKRELLLQRALVELTAFKAKYTALEELAAVFTAIDFVTV